jgi:hypothetical protein
MVRKGRTTRARRRLLSMAYRLVCERGRDGCSCADTEGNDIACWFGSTGAMGGRAVSVV